MEPDIINETLWDCTSFNDFFNTSIVGLASFCLQQDTLKTLYLSEGILKRIGYTKEEYAQIMNAHSMDLLYEEDRARLWITLWETVNANCILNTSFRIRLKSGKLNWVHAIAKITSRKMDTYIIKAAFLALTDETMLYYDIANHATDGIYVISKSDYRILYVNQTLRTQLKLSGLPEVIGQKCYKLLCDSEIPCQNCPLHANKVGKYDHNRLHKSYMIHSHDIEWEGMKASALYINDVSEQKKAISEVSQVYNNIPGAAFRCRFDNDWTVLSANDGLFTFTGYSREEFAAMGNRMSAVIYPADQNVMIEKITSQLIGGNTSIENENRLVCKDHTIKWISIKGQLLADPDGEEYFYCVFVDISKQKEEEQRATDAQKNLNIAMEHAKMLYWEYEFESETAYVDAATQERFGLPHVLKNYPESYLALGFVSEEDVPIYREKTSYIHDGGEYVEFVAKIKTFQMKYVWMKLRFTGVKDENGKSVRAICTSEVITEYKELEDRFQTTLMQIHIDSWIYDIKRHALILSQGWQSTSIYNGQIEIKNVPETHIRDHFCHPDDADKLRKFYHSVDNGEKQTTDIFRFWEEDKKEYRWRQCSYTVIIVDRTEVKRQEQVIAAALQWDYDFIASVNLADDTMNMYRSNHEKPERVKGQLGEVVSYRNGYESTCRNFIVEKDKELFDKSMSPEYIKKQLEITDIYEVTYHVCNYSGEVRAKRVRFTAYQDNHNITIFSCADVTDMLADQEQQKNALRDSLLAAEKANRAKSDFLSRISHDMRTPLNGILGLTNLMKDKADWTQIQEDLTQLEISGRYLLNLINDTLDVSKIENGKMTLQPTVCDEKIALQNVINLLRPNIDAKKIHFVTKIKDLSYSMLYIDIGRMQQLVMNILSNAIKFTPEHGTINFTVTNLKNSESELIDRIIIEDNGIGISPEFLPHLFEPFSQENTNRTSQYQGTGLGMTISKQIVELMGGTISVKSELGKGTTFDFTVHMPKATKEQIEAWKEDRTQKCDFSILNRKRILLCEDHPLNAEITKRLLNKMEINLELANNGKVGVEMFANSPDNYYDMILMDVRMPVMDGLEATEKIRSMDRKDAKQIPIIAMTANALNEDILAGKRAGMNAHIAKPINPQLMYETMAELLTAKEEEGVEVIKDGSSTE